MLQLDLDGVLVVWYWTCLFIYNLAWQNNGHALQKQKIVYTTHGYLEQPQRGDSCMPRATTNDLSTELAVGAKRKGVPEDTFLSLDNLFTFSFFYSLTCILTYT